MDQNKKQQLLDVVKRAQLPQDVEKLFVEDIEKQQEVTDDFILEIADALERLGAFFKTAGEVQNEFLDAVAAEAKNVGDALQVLDSIGEGLEDNASAQVNSSPAPEAASNSNPAVPPTTQSPS